MVPMRVVDLGLEQERWSRDPGSEISRMWQWTVCSEEDSSIRWALGVHLNAHLYQVTPKPNKTVFMKSDLMGKQDCGRLLI